MISKSSYVKFTQCPKSLWLHFNKPDQARDMSDIAEGNIEAGNLVGELAKSCFRGTVDCSRRDADGRPLYDSQVKATADAILSGADAIAEASFSVGDLFCAVDILKRDGDGFSIYEVKSSLSVKDDHLTDAAFQKYVLEKCGLTVNHLYIMHPNKEYELHGSLDVHGYFTVECMDDCEPVLQSLQKMDAGIAGIGKTLAETNDPIVPFRPHCKDCEFSAYCLTGIPADCVGSLSGIAGKAFDFYNKRIVTIADYVQTPQYGKGKKNHRREIQIQKVLAHDSAPYVDKGKLQEFLDDIHYPIYHLDFETTKKIIPTFEGFHPGESYPFQYSLHIEHANGTLEHKEFLGEEENCVRALAERLVADIPMDSQLLAFHASTEVTVIKYLAQKCPDLSAHLLNLSEHFVDLMKPFQEGIYFDPGQKGSNSIKDVMPALCPDMADAYHELPGVHNGTEALTMFPKMIAMKGTPEYAEVRRGMLLYCELDTLSMVKVLAVLKRAARV